MQDEEKNRNDRWIITSCMKSHKNLFYFPLQASSSSSSFLNERRVFFKISTLTRLRPSYDGWTHGAGHTFLKTIHVEEAVKGRTALLQFKCRHVDIRKVTHADGLQYLDRLTWNHRLTVLETAELFWQTGHRSTWPGLCAQCSWNLITWREGAHGSGWCNDANKAAAWCVILAAVLIVCTYSNWGPRNSISNVCVCVCLDVYAVGDTWRELGVTLLRQVDPPGRPVLTSWYVSRGAHTVVVWLMSRHLSVSVTKCTVLYDCFLQRCHRAGVCTLCYQSSSAAVSLPSSYNWPDPHIVIMCFHMWINCFTPHLVVEETLRNPKSAWSRAWERSVSSVSGQSCLWVHTESTSLGWTVPHVAEHMRL